MATIIKGLLESEPAVGARAGRRVHLGHARAVRHPLAVVRRRLVPADRDDRADFRRRPGARVRRAQDWARPAESEVGAGTLFSSGLIAGGSLCGILYAVLVGTGNIGSDAEADRQRDAVPARRHQRLHRQRAAVPRPGRRARARRAEEGDVRTSGSGSRRTEKSGIGRRRGLLSRSRSDGRRAAGDRGARPT